MKIHPFILLLVCTGLFLACESPTQETKPPNILWITTEDMGTQLGCYGDAHAHTPFLDQLAAEGVLYTNAIATAPVCAPARSTLITGMYQSSIGSHHMRSQGWFPEAYQYFPQYLREAGYYCTNTSKEDYNLVYEATDIWDASSKEAHWRNRPNKDQPFFAVFNFLGTHEGRTNQLERHLEVVKDLPKDVLLEDGEPPLPPYFPDTPLVNELWTRYYNNIAGLDAYVQDLYQQLEEDGLVEDTIILFYSDHGAGVPIHKRWLYDTGLKVPLIVKAPKKYAHLVPHAQGEPTDELVSFVDMAPTALTLAGIPVPEHMQGRPFLGTDLPPERTYTYGARDRMDERYDMQRAVRDKQYKYIRYYEFPKPFVQYMNTPEKGDIMKEIRRTYAEGSLPEPGVKLMAQRKPVEELFDLEADPQELNDLAQNPDYAVVLERMRGSHVAWSVEIGDAGLIPEPILRQWEADYNKPIYRILRENEIPMEAIQQVALSDQLDFFIQNLSHTNEAVRYWAATGIGNYATQSTATLYTQLSSLLADAYPSVQIAAARALCLLGHEKDGWATLSKGLTNEG